MKRRFCKATVAAWALARAERLIAAHRLDMRNGMIQFEGDATPERAIAYGEVDALLELAEEFNLHKP